MTIGKIALGLFIIAMCAMLWKAIQKTEYRYDAFEEGCTPTELYVRHEGLKRVYDCSEPPEDCDPPEELDGMDAILWCKEQKDLKNVEG